MPIKTGSLQNFTCEPFSHEGVKYDTYRHGKGPGVILMHEIPGVTPELLGLAERIAEDGFYVVVPSLFGRPEQPANFLNVRVQALRACISREFHTLAANESSPIVNWLRALCRKVYGEVGGKGLGAIGLCITGNFALALMVDPEGRVVAPVMGEPSLPFPIGEARKSALHLAPHELQAVKQRLSAEKLTILGLRFTNDGISPCQRFTRLRHEFADQFEGIEIPSWPGNPYNIPQDAHSVLTADLEETEDHPTQQALLRVLQFLHERLR